jgi:hypothetical protein
LTSWQRHFLALVMGVYQSSSIFAVVLDGCQFKRVIGRKQSIKHGELIVLSSLLTFPFSHYIFGFVCDTAIMYQNGGLH